MFFPKNPKQELFFRIVQSDGCETIINLKKVSYFRKQVYDEMPTLSFFFHDFERPVYISFSSQETRDECFETLWNMTSSANYPE